MPLTREDLIARSLLHANMMTGGALNLPAMLDSNQFNQLSPESKAEVVERYAALSKVHPASHQTPSIGSTIAHGARAGLVGSVLPTALAGVIAVPTIAAVSASMGNRVAMLDILKRTASPLALASGIGIAAGITGSLLGRAMTADNNKYLQNLVNSVSEDEDPDTRKVRAMALVAASPALNRRSITTGNVGHNMTQQIISRYLGQGDVTKDMFEKIIPSQRLLQPNGYVAEYPYNDFSYVHGVGTLTGDAVENNPPKYKIVPNV